MVKYNEATYMIKNVLILLTLLYLIAVLSMYLLQRQMMYFPRDAPEHTRHEVIDIESGWLMTKVVTQGSQLEPAVIYFGGNGEDAYAGAERMKAAFIDKATYYVNYLGYGGSTGSPSEATITQSARDVYEYVSARHIAVAVADRSLGSGVAMELASEYAVSQLVLISPYDSIANVASKYYPFVPRSLIKDKFDSVSLVSKSSTKTLIIMARDDYMISISHSLRLLEVLKHTQPVSKVYDLADHNNVHLKDGFMPLIRGARNSAAVAMGICANI
jgi:fermentation-respiration switch protein FrsA (DUF1100 family)